MLYLHSLSESEEIFKALSTPMRLRIMELIYQNDQLSMNDLAEALDLTNSAISLHVSKLESAGLVTIKTTSGKRGIMKIVQPVYSRLIVDMAPQSAPRHCYQDEIYIRDVGERKLTMLKRGKKKVEKDSKLNINQLAKNLANKKFNIKTKKPEIKFRLFS